MFALAVLHIYYAKALSSLSYISIAHAGYQDVIPDKQHVANMMTAYGFWLR